MYPLASSVIMACTTANELQAKRQWEHKGGIREDSLEEVLLKTVQRSLQEVGKSMPSYRNSMWTGMDETRGVKGKDGDEARRKHRSGCKSPVIFPSKKTVHYLENNGERQRNLNIICDLAAQLLPRNNH